ncbi:hypothetical protein H0H92_005271 [Tricholoma furcatifolium]|nr:hypothetical protein H0H92_005271 [Tricholoma furcatifolium]
MGRKPKTGPNPVLDGKVTAGRASWATGSKDEFLRSKKQEFSEAQTLRKTSEFYHKIAQMFIQRYGWDLPLEKDGPAGECSAATCASVLQWPDNLSEEEQDTRRKTYSNLRLKLGNWFRYRMNTVQSGGGQAQEERQAILTSFNQMSKVRPRKQTALNLYSSENYKKKIKMLVDDAWKKMSKEQIGIPGARLRLAHDYTRQAWEKESAEMRQNFEKEADKTYKKAMDDYKTKQVWVPRTAEEYHEAIEDAATILIPFADALAQRFGLYTSIMLCGPMGNGKVELRSVHSSTEMGETSLMWPEADPDGFSMAEKSIVAYGKKFFSKSTVESRRIEMEGDDSISLQSSKSVIDLDAFDDMEPEPRDTFLTLETPTKGELSRKNTEMKTNSPSMHPAEPQLSTQSTASHPTATEPIDSVPASTMPTDSAPGLIVLTDLTEHGATLTAATDSAPASTSLPAEHALLSTSPPDPPPALDLSQDPAAASASLVEPSPFPHYNFPSHPPQAIANAIIPVPRNADIDLKSWASHNVPMMEGLTWLKDQDWGAEWDLCIRGLIEFERRHGFPNETKRLSIENRPDEYKQWFKGGRKYTNQKTNGEFPSNWWTWWHDIKTVSSDVDVQPGEEEVDWDELDIPGTSGMFLLVVGLLWWGEKNQEIGRRYDGPHSWLAGVREVSRALWESGDPNIRGPPGEKLNPNKRKRAGNEKIKPRKKTKSKP